jgi:hypothetical protein
MGIYRANQRGDSMNTPKIYGFVNGGSPGWYNVAAVTEDGLCVAGHLCSHPSYGQHDIGVTSNWKHEIYRKHYPDGFDVEWVADVSAHEGIQRAFALNRAMTAEEHEARCAAVEPPPTPDAVDPVAAD